ncbi:hypothetical protein CRE_09408 [Caenorhabditis remanei]|uniref:F-box domain-containing protein n=1 Tax=Caenorhabditis remanei TaxID=31234 RepID=E3LIQ1_CAERE|nr:hypothetical protein CRE_09408 [Caenorhabditis remanei]
MIPQFHVLFQLPIFPLPFVHQVTKMSLSKFPLLELPRVALNEVLKLFTPFEIIFFSFCSKRIKSICLSIRTVPKCKEALHNFSVWIDCVQEINLQFTYFPSELWVFYLEKYPVSEHTKRNKFWSVLPQRFLKMCYSKGRTESSCQKMAEPIKGLGDYRVMRVPCHRQLNENVNGFLLEWSRYNSKENQTIIDAFCNHPVPDFLLTGDTSNDSSKNDMLTSILKNQNAKETMTLWINPSSDFSFDFSQLNSSLETLDITYSHWIKLQDILDVRCRNLYLRESNFLQDDYKLLIDKWRDGWTPNWETMTIELNEDIDVDTCVEGEYIDLEPEDYKSKKFVCGNFPIQLNRFKGYFENEYGETVFMHGYRILRADGMIASIGIIDDEYRVGWFRIK